ncbi:Protein of unknown function (DUF2442) [Desulfosporosinus orientis DSM 765]|uniref:DUF2442 domain-containing protein n=1 Tax=Desulfosporosinus orientis (strain ATCC 19365 / DSM 765 / NCIMB 8382 / VKM B-1628 / Singapore I) TaxID=768706 RepID=G7WF03_DESOD|nr:DUF2442 domain-containing protein [Desulfosporosinus orientis]AET67614.1 Protein of unknown function (DUF2442) [Desulfosporosinus orientis DSM 765]
MIYPIAGYKGGNKISRIINVTANDDYTLLIEFEHGNQIRFNMEEMVRKLPYNAISDLEIFKKFRVEDTAICWDADKPTLIPLRLTVDNILFTIRG